MKRIALSIVSAVLALSFFGCASGTESSSSESSSAQAEATSSDAQTDGATDASSGKDLHGIVGPVSEPPIACTQRIKFQNIFLTIPESWDAAIGAGNYLKLMTDDGFFGSFKIDTSSLNSSSADDEISAFVDQNVQQALLSGLVLEEGYKIERSGDLAYVILPFLSKRLNDAGELKEFWGYSFCGFDNECIMGDLSYDKDDKDAMATLRWILENIEVV